MGKAPAGAGGNLLCRCCPYELIFFRACSLETERVAETHGTSRSRCEAFGEHGLWGTSPMLLPLSLFFIGSATQSQHNSPNSLPCFPAGGSSVKSAAGSFSEPADCLQVEGKVPAEQLTFIPVLPGRPVPFSRLLHRKQRVSEIRNSRNEPESL
jgi:hypothetical protein